MVGHEKRTARAAEDPGGDVRASLALHATTGGTEATSEQAEATVLRASRCSRCGRPLRDPKSRAMGMGPICAARFRADMAMRAEAQTAGVFVTVNGRPLRHVVRHSPTGMEWGYGGSGPADLALSILTDYFGRCRSRPIRGSLRGIGEIARLVDNAIVDKLYQQFKWDVIAGLPREGWRLTGEQIASWLAAHGVTVPMHHVVYEGRRIAWHGPPLQST